MSEEWAWAVAGLKEVTEYAGELGIVPGIEPLNRFETYFINRHDQALLLCEEVGNNLGSSSTLSTLTSRRPIPSRRSAMSARSWSTSTSPTTTVAGRQGPLRLGPHRRSAA
jgi:hypothetical protein